MKHQELPPSSDGAGTVDADFGAPECATLPPETQAELEYLDHFAYWMDAAFRVPGTRWRFGLDSVIGLMPGIGDVGGALVSFYLIGRAWKLRIPFSSLLQMLWNAFLELTIGSIPIVGDLFDAWYKANLRNIELLKAALQDRHR